MVLKYFNLLFILLYSFQGRSHELSLNKNNFLDEKIIPELNFSSVVYNKNHKIYRSQALGSIGLQKVFIELSKRGFETPEYVLYFGRHGYEVRKKEKANIKYEKFVEDENNFLTEKNIKFLHPFFSKLYISGDNPALDKKEYSLNFHGNDFKVASSLACFEALLEIILSAKKPILFHCSGGRHRSGMLALTIRYLQGGQWVEDFKKPIVVTNKKKEKTYIKNLAEKEYLDYSCQEARQDNLDFVRWFLTTKKFSELKIRYQQSLNYFCKEEEP